MFGQSGMDMMMKSLGLDPQEMKNQVEQAKVSLANGVNHFDARLTAIDTKLDRVEALLLELRAHFLVKPLEPMSQVSSQVVKQLTEGMNHGG